MTPTEYLDSVAPEIKGWLHIPDAHALMVLNEAQIELDVRGAMLEIGVYQGKSLALLALLARGDEKVVGLDRFDLGQASVDKSAETLARVIPNERLPNITMLRFDSQHGNMNTVAKTMGGLARMLHIDGGHSYEEVASDLRRFHPMVIKTGLIAMDDYFQRDDPGVAVAVIDFCRGGFFVPFMSSFNKMYLCRRTVAPLYIGFMLARYEHESRIDMVAGFPLLTINTRKPMTIQECKTIFKTIGI